MRNRYRTYVRWGHRRVDGYTESPVFALLSAIDDLQRARGVTGNAVEIGVHHGQLLIGMALLQRDAEQTVAIDLFDDQETNVDQSGKGDLARFRHNLARWAPDATVVVHEGDSTRVRPGDVPAMTGARLFSVDGGHTADIVDGDMRLAEQSLTDGGIVIADDVFNDQWPDVCVGTLRYLRDEADLVPFAVGFNKTLFTQRRHADAYRAEIARRFGRKTMTVPLTNKSFDGHPVVVLVRVPLHPAHIARRSEAARRVAHLITGAMAATKGADA